MLNDKIKELYKKAGFSLEIEGKWPNIYSVGTPMERLVALVIEDCAIAAETHARSYSGGDSGHGSIGAAAAVRSYGASLLK